MKWFQKLAILLVTLMLAFSFACGETEEQGEEETEEMNESGQIMEPMNPPDNVIRLVKR